MRYAFLVLAAAPLFALACGRVLEDDEDDAAPTGADAGEGGAPAIEASGPTPDAADAPHESSEDDAGYAVPFSMTFEQTLVGPDGANQPTTATFAERPIIDGGSAKVDTAASPTLITRTFPEQARLFVSFYVRFDGPLSGSLTFARLGGSAGDTLIELKASATNPSRLILSAQVPGETIPLGEVAADKPWRFGLQAIRTGASNQLVVGVAILATDFGDPYTTQVTTSLPSKIELGSFYPLPSTSVAVVFDDVLGRTDDFAPPTL
ncbi:MAG: hypothetical protein KF782_15695 [Labilithrix sp.]|nr:hypothetical protein [Labilithrix sp.]